VSIGVLEWTPVLFLTGFFSGLLLKCVATDEKIHYKNLLSYIVIIIAVLGSSIILNKMITALYQVINHSSANVYVYRYILWQSDNLFNQILKLFEGIFMAFFNDFIIGNKIDVWQYVFVWAIIFYFLIAIFSCIKKKSVMPLLIVLCVIGSAFSLNIITGNPLLATRIYIYLSEPVAVAFMLLFFVIFSLNPVVEKTVQSFLLVFIHKGLKFATITIVVLTILYQSKELNRLFYLEYLRYEADVRTAYNIINEIEKQAGSIKKPIVFIGPFTGSANVRMGYIIFEHDRWNIPENMLSAGRIIAFMRQLGYEVQEVTSEVDLSKAKYDSHNMPTYPKAGAIQVFDNFCIVKLGEITN
jgi:hypothetical protein